MARQPKRSPVQKALLAEYEYDGIQTCAADGSCQLVCPVGIDTGKLIKGFRSEEHGKAAEQAGLNAAKHWSAVERAARGGLATGGPLGAPMRAMSAAARTAFSHEVVPSWPKGMPRPAVPRMPETERDGAAAVYMPACINRMFGRSRLDGSGPELAEALVEVSARAGLPLWIPTDAAGHCCAVPWSSKGYRRGYAHMANATIEALWRWSDGGRLPVVIDATSCAHGLAELGERVGEANRERHAQIEVLDSIAWAHDHLLPRLEVKRRIGSMTVHPTCSARHLVLVRKLEGIAAALADEPVSPASATCCAFAGDRGLLHPELTSAATRHEAAEVVQRPTDAYVSSNRTCELGLEQATGRRYESFVFLLEELTR
jgi:D-lactate dehydrogenase